MRESGPESGRAGRFAWSWRAALDAFAARYMPGAGAQIDEAWLREDDTAGLTRLQRVKGCVVDALGADGWVPFHAAAICLGQDVLVVPGPSGGGKSTLATVLASYGQSVADDLVLLRREGRQIIALVPPMPISLLAGAAGTGAAREWLHEDAARRDQKSLVLPPRMLSGRYRLGAACIVRRGSGAALAELRDASAGEASRALVGSMARYRGGGAEYAKARRGAWNLVCGLIDSVPVFVLECDLMLDDAQRIGERIVSVKGACHGRQCVAD